MKRIFLATAAALLLSFLAVWLIGEDPDADLSGKERLARIVYFESLKPQAEQGGVKAQYAIALLYRDGIGVDKDLRAAVRWLTKAAERGHPNSQYALGRMYEKGEGGYQDIAKAREWYILASRLGRHAGAQFALGQLYFKGSGVPQDFAEAHVWFRKAARRGHPAAQYLMGAMFQDGWGVKSDYVEAYKWYTLAIPKASQVTAVNRSHDPLKARRLLAAKMNNFQISQGEKRAREWRPGR